MRDGGGAEGLTLVSLIGNSGPLPPVALTMLPTISESPVAGSVDCHASNAPPFGSAVTVGATLHKQSFAFTDIQLGNRNQLR